MPAYRPIDNSAKTLYSLDIIARLRYLEGCDAEHDMPECAIEPGTEHDQPADEHDHEYDDCLCFCECWCHDGGGDPDEIEEYKALKAFADEAEQYCAEWHHGVTLYQEDQLGAAWAEEEAVGLGQIKREDLGNWPFTHLDWAAAAEAIRSEEYTEVDFDGVGFYVPNR